VLDQSARSLTAPAAVAGAGPAGGAAEAGDDAAAPVSARAGAVVDEGVGERFEVGVLLVVVAATAVDVTSKANVPVIAVGAQNAAVRTTKARQLHLGFGVIFQDLSA